MSKTVVKDCRIILGGQDVSRRVVRWKIDARVGELAVVMLQVVLDSNMFKVDKSAVAFGKGFRATTGPTSRNGLEIVQGYKVTVNDIDISSHVAGYDFVARCGELAQLKLYIQADRDILSINGCYPWEMPDAAP